MIHMYEKEFDVKSAFAAALQLDLETLVSRQVLEVDANIPDYRYLPRGAAHDVQLAKSVGDHLRLFIKLVTTGEGTPVPTTSTLAFRAATVRAEQGFPVESVLRTYQLCTRVIWQWLMDTPRLELHRELAIRSCWPIWLDYVDEATRHTTEAYVTWSKLRAVEDSRSRRNFLERMLSGEFTEVEALRWLEILGYQRASEYVIMVLYRSSESMTKPAHDVIEIVSAMIQGLPQGRSGVIETVRDDSIVLLVLGEELDPVGLLGSIKSSLKVAYSARAVDSINGAVSDTYSGWGDFAGHYIRTDKAARAARLDNSIVLVSSLTLFDHALACLHPDIERVCPPPLRKLVDICNTRHPEWGQTLTAWAQSGLNAKEASRALHVHPNTIYYRLGQIKKDTGLNLHGLADTLDAFIAVRLLVKAPMEGTSAARSRGFLDEEGAPASGRSTPDL